MPPIPLRDRFYSDIGEEFHNPPELTAAFERRWIKDDYFWAAFAPELPDYRGYFQSLNFNKSCIPVDASGNSFVLRNSVLQEWLSLENNLIRTAQSIKISYSLHMPLYTRTPNPPSAYGYQRVFSSYQHATRSVWASRRAFLNLMTYTSCLIGCATARDPDPPSCFALPQWAQTLLTSHGAPYTWINGLCNSWIANFSVDRLGGFINTSVTQWQWPSCVLNTFLRLRIPLWFWFPSTEVQTIPQTYIRFFQRPPDILSQSSPELAQVSTANSPTKTNWDEFFIKRSSENAEHEESESEVDKQKRLDRLSHSHTNGRPVCPGRRGAQVYEWKESMACPGTYIRVSVPRATVQDKWEQFTDAQKIYDAYHNEWDLCPILDNNENSTNTEEENDEITPVPVDASSYTHQEPWSDTGSWNAIQLTFDDDRILFDSFLTILTSRYGLLRTAHPELSDDAKTFKRVKFWLGFTSDTQAIEEADQVRARVLINSFVSSVIPTPDLFDLNTPSTTGRTTVDLSIGFLNHDTAVYQLFPSQRLPTTNVILIHDPTDAMHFLRSTDWHSSPPFALQQLVSRGIPFTHLHLPQPHVSSTRVRIPTFHLGWQGDRSSGSAGDYHQYLQLRSELLLNKSVARAGLGMGGLIWRLVLDDIDIEDLFATPDADTLSHATRVDYADFEYMMFTLNDNEREIISGVYHMPTGNFNMCYRQSLLYSSISTGVPNQQTTKSWWPSHHVWQKSGFFVGYWTRSCEEWFQKRQREILDGKATLHTAAQWSRTLKFERRQIAKMSDSLASYTTRYLRTKCTVAGC